MLYTKNYFLSEKFITKKIKYGFFSKKGGCSKNKYYSLNCGLNSFDKKDLIKKNIIIAKNKIGLKEAFADRQAKGYTWNNLMLTKWVDHDGKEHRVLEDYERNKLLVDLHAQPEAIVEELDQTIANAISENKTYNKLESDS